jgi:hypothetical protein
MPEVNLLPILVATIVAFVLSATYYVILGGQLATVSDGAIRPSDDHDRAARRWPELPGHVRSRLRGSRDRPCR